MNKHIVKRWVDSNNLNEGNYVVCVLGDNGLLNKELCNIPNSSYSVQLTIDIVDEIL